MTTDLYIVTYRRDFRYLKFGLRSIGKYATGFRRTVIAVPRQDVPELKRLILDAAQFTKTSPDHFHVYEFDEWPNQGFLHHMYLVCYADQISKADFVCHMDSDCFFSKPVTPATYFENGKPVIVHAPYTWLIAQQSNLALWQQAVERALGWKPEHEFMRRHPNVFHRELYTVARFLVCQHTKLAFDAFMRQQRNEFPQTFAEFPTLGEVAWMKFHDKYTWRDQSKGQFPEGNPMEFCWSHREPLPEDVQRFTKAGLV